MKNAIAILIFVLPSVVLAQCVDGDCENGVGTYVWESGSVSNGPWKDGVLNGIVQEILYDDEGHLIGTFDGQMIMGMANGYGVQTLYSGDNLLGTYIGNWKNDDWNGLGMWIEPDGYIEQGIFRDGELVK